MAASLDDTILELRASQGSDADPSGRAFVPLAEALLQAGRFDEALALVGDGLAGLPDFATGHLLFAWIHRARGDEAAAAETFRQVLALDPLNVRALRDLGRMRAAAGDTDEAARLFLRATGVDGEDADLDDRVEAVEAAITPEGGEWVAPSGDESEEGPGTLVVASPAFEESAPPVGEAMAAGPVDALPDADPEWFDGSWEDDGVAEEPPFPGSEVQTRTIAELYLSQGLVERAIQVYRDLVAANPSDAGLAARLAELDVPAAPVGGSDPEAFPVEPLGADLDDGRWNAEVEDATSVFLEPPPGFESDSPFAWTGALEPEADDIPWVDPVAVEPSGTDTQDGVDVPVADYLTSIMEWAPAGLPDVEAPALSDPQAAEPDAPEPQAMDPVATGADDPGADDPAARDGLTTHAGMAPWGSRENPVGFSELAPDGGIPSWVPVESLAPDGALPRWVEISSLAPDPRADDGQAPPTPPPAGSSDADFRAWLEQLRL